ncbi:MAG: hypothetical protein PGN23_01695 [Sphingomonas adhaesiva]|uniref:hypothetical protein n=1 Tax=Sphingomonas adhaesiva TaxID=28212 RepID=UPI002FF4ED7C
MNGTFHFRVDPERNLIVTTIDGFFDEDVYARYMEARAAAFRELRCGPNEHLSLSDLRGMNIQSQDIVAAFSAMLAQPTYQSKRLGLVIGSSLARMQLSRALGTRAGGNARVFEHYDDAEHWVLTGEIRDPA